MNKSANTATLISENITTGLLADQIDGIRGEKPVSHQHNKANEKYVAECSGAAANDTLSLDEVRRLHTAVVEGESANIGQRACSFAAAKVDEGLAMIMAAYTYNEGIYVACENKLLALSDIEELPPAARSMVAEFLNTLVPESGLNRVDQARAAAASLTRSEALKFVYDLLCLRSYLENAMATP